MEQVQNCVVKLRSNPRRHRDKVYVGCGAGFGGDRPMAALKLLQRVKELNYLVLECLAERTLADRYRIMVSGGKGYDPRVKEWMSVLLPLALERKVCIITNMGAMDPLGAQKEVLNLASILGLEITVAVAYESSFETQGSPLSSFQSIGAGQGRSTYLGAASIVNCLENYKPNVVITSRVADAALFLAPMEGGWKGWGEISYGGHQCLKRAQAAEYLVRSWIGERYPDIDEKIVSYIMGYDSLKAVGGDKDSYSSKQVMDARLRMDGLFELEEHAVQFVEEFIALYTNGPAGGGGISTGQRKEIILQKMLVDRENIFWRAHAKKASIPCLQDQATDSETVQMHISQSQKNPTSRAMGIQHVDTSMGTAPPVRASPGKKIALYHIAHSRVGDKGNDMNFSVIPHFPGDIGRLMAVITPDWVKNVVSPLLDLSSFPDEQAIQRRINLLELVSVEIYEVPGICSLNVVVRNILDGGVNCSRRIDRHGKTLSDLILCQEVVLPP
ncbi:hypothetical protein SETIT_2G125300v2 [Setaria italica]|uniref:Uncharacterized protein n=1 Tax=Setaria italica TaxID=4555 RepID=A0A368PXX9_SETIT|nr:hypothetical protein SETIT_2G125300v2 [Setaria italica]